MNKYWVIHLLIAILLSSCTLGGQAAREVQPGWHLYSNSKYGYEIQYPEGYDLWETGIESERDGAEIRIGLHEYQAPVPVLDVKVAPRMAESGFPTLGMQVPTLTASMADILVNSMMAKQVDYRWTTTNDLAFVEIYLDGVIFRFDADAGSPELHATPWWEIISTFRFTG